MDASIAHFTDTTGATPEQAQFFLQSANGDLETAMSTYYESGGATAASSAEPAAEATNAGNNEAEDQEMAAALAASQADAPSGPQTLGGGTAPAASSGSASGSAPSSRPTSSAAIRPTTNKKKFGTFATLGAKDDDDDSEDEDKKKPQNYFAGGEKSGISVQDPNAGKRKNRDDAGQDAPNDLVRSLLKKAAEGSASREEQERSKPAASSSSSAFRGSGNTLGSEDTPSQVVPDPEAPAPRPSSSRGSFLPSLPGMYPRGFANLFGGGGGNTPAAPAAQQQQEEAEEDRDLPEDYNEESVTRHLTLWRDGFSVEDGELMRYDEPRNMALLKAIQEGTAPQHILNVRFGQQVELRVAQRTGEDYVPPPKKPMKAFGGSGNRLGAPTSATASPSTSSTPQPAGILQGGSSTTPAISSSLATVFEVDGTKPVTTLQIRLGDGTRQTARFNHTHTIADIRSWINAGNPGMASRNYVLMTTFPSKELSEENMSIEEAKLMGSVVVQKWT